MDWNAALYDPIYARLGVSAVLSVGSDDFELTVIDKTSGELVDTGSVGIQTIRPCADVRMSELVIDPDALPDGTLAMNGKTWRIDHFAYRPGPGGEQSGEVRMILMEPNV